MQYTHCDGCKYALLGDGYIVSHYNNGYSYVMRSPCTGAYEYYAISAANNHWKLMYGTITAAPLRVAGSFASRNYEQIKKRVMSVQLSGEESGVASVAKSAKNVKSQTQVMRPLRLELMGY